MKNYWLNKRDDFTFEKEVFIDGEIWKVYTRDVFVDFPVMLDPETLEPYKPLCKVFVSERNAISGDVLKQLPRVVKSGQSIPCQHLEDQKRTKIIET
jgi:hypothetical protein